MIILFNPRAAKTSNCRFPLSVLALAAVLEGREEYAIVDGNIDPNPTATILSLLQRQRVEMLGVTVMPGPQMVAAVESCRAIHQRFPQIPIVWGGYFPSIYPDTALNAPYVTYAVRGQGERTLLELIAGLRGELAIEQVRGLSYRLADGSHRHNPERVMEGRDAFPWFPYHRIAVEPYLKPSFFGRRTGVHIASIGCPFQCSFCGVVTAFGSREKFESPARTEAVLRHLQSGYGMDGVQFYDENFFLREDHAREQADRLAPLGLRWWAEGRVDVLSRYSDATLTALQRAGCRMIFFGAESGSDWVLQQMKKGITTAQTVEVTARLRRFGIIPELSFVIGNPQDPERDVAECLAFIRRLKQMNPDVEIILYHYTPVPQRETMYGVTQFEFPATPDEWASEKWQNFVRRIDPATPWMKPETKRLIDDFELVVASRWPTVQDFRQTRWTRAALKLLSSWRYRMRVYSHPVELRWANSWIHTRQPKFESV